MQVKDAIEFIRANGDLPHWTDGQIIYGIKAAIKCCAFTYTCDENGKLNGICWGKWTAFSEEGPTQIHIDFMRGSLKTFLAFIKRVFPMCKEATSARHGNMLTYRIYARQ